MKKTILLFWGLKKSKNWLKNGQKHGQNFIFPEKDHTRGIPDNCHFFYTDKIFGAKNLHPSARKSGQIGFCDKIA